MPLIARLLSVIDRTADPRPAALARVLCGLLVIAKGVQVWSILARAFDPASVRLPYVSGVPVPTAELLPVLIAVWLAAGIAFTLGWRTRATGLVAVAAMGYTLLLDQQTYSNHLYLLAIMVTLLVLADSGARFSLDARRRGHVSATPAWPILLLKIQLTIVYVFGALSKINAVYLSGAVIANNLSVGGIIAVPASWQVPGSEMAAGIALLSIMVELFLAIAFWVRPLRLPAATIGVLFHLGISLTLPAGVAPELLIFSAQMAVLYLLFFNLGPLWAALDRRRPWLPVRARDPRLVR